MYVVVIEQLLDGVELPSRDGIVKLQDSAELRRRVGDGHSHDGSCRCVFWCGYSRPLTLPIFYIAEAN